MIRRPPRSTQSRSSAASDVYKRQDENRRNLHEHDEPPRDAERVEPLRLEATLERDAQSEAEQRAEHGAEDGGGDRLDGDHGAQLPPLQADRTEQTDLCLL